MYHSAERRADRHHRRRQNHDSHHRENHRADAKGSRGIYRHDTVQQTTVEYDRHDSTEALELSIPPMVLTRSETGKVWKAPSEWA